MRRAAWRVAATGALAMVVACGPPPLKAAPPPIPVEVGKATLDADGVDSTLVIARPRAPEGADDRERLVVTFTSTGGLLSSSAAPIEADGTARVTLFADREEALLGRAQKPVTVRATVARALQDVETGTTQLTFVVPQSGAPSLRLSADPPVALANGTDTVELTLTASRLPAGSVVQLRTDGGQLSAPSMALEGEGATVQGSVTLTAPAAQQDVLVTATEAGGAFDTLLVSFVADGAPQFDLGGVFAQAAPARIRMRSPSLDPDPQCVVAPAFIKVTMTQDGDTVHADYETCFVTLAPVTSVVGEVTNAAPPAFVSAIPHVVDSFTLDSRALGAAFEPHKSIVVSGAELDDPDDDVLPSEENDPRVRDSDGDDRPGVTVINSLAGEQNIVFRNRGETHGKVESSSRVSGDTPGALSALPESKVLGVGNAFIPDFEALPSVFEMVRVDGQHESPDMDTNGDHEITCAEIVDAQDFLFTVTPPPTPMDCAGVDP